MDDVQQRSVSDGAVRRGTALLTEHGLDHFEALWTLPLKDVDDPNLDRGGWSRVGRIELTPSDGGEPTGFYLKRQSNHLSRSLRHPLGEPTFAREFRAIQRLQQAGIPTVEPVYFAQRSMAGERQAILITRALDGYRSLDEWYRQWPDLSTGERSELTRATARLVSQLHEARLIHNSLYPKHVFVRLDDECSDARLIDLETTRIGWRGWQDRIRDLETLHRRSSAPSDSERLLFLRHYLGERFGELHDWLIEAILARSARRR